MFDRKVLRFSVAIDAQSSDAAMPHLPFASAYPSFAVSDSRGAFSARTVDDGALKRMGAISGSSFSRSQRFEHSQAPPSKPTTASPLVFRQAATVTNVGGDPAAMIRSSHPNYNSAAFTGAIGHFSFGGERVGDGKANRPTMVDPWTVRTRHPCDEPPGPGKYDAEIFAVEPRTDFASYQRENEKEGKLRRRATARLGQTSVRSRLEPTYPKDTTPGPGAYPLSEFSDFVPRVRPVSVRGLTSASGGGGGLSPTPSSPELRSPTKSPPSSPQARRSMLQTPIESSTGPPRSPLARDVTMQNMSTTSSVPASPLLQSSVSVVGSTTSPMRSHEVQPSPMRSPPSTANVSVMGGYHEGQTTRAATSSFGTAPRSNIAGGGANNRGEFNRFGMPQTLPPSGGYYSPLSHQDLVWLSMKRTAPAPRNGKTPPVVKPYDMWKRAG